eukprot:maker-scaffold_7-snap-gene-10.27-mRNA-1 protein AED:0.06 eAED:0.06 QI:117/1/1/1/0.8/0.66/6/63/234
MFSPPSYSQNKKLCMIRFKDDFDKFCTETEELDQVEHIMFHYWDSQRKPSEIVAAVRRCTKLIGFVFHHGGLSNAVEVLNQIELKQIIVGEEVTIPDYKFIPRILNVQPNLKHIEYFLNYNQFRIYCNMDDYAVKFIAQAISEHEGLNVVSIWNVHESLKVFERTLFTLLHGKVSKTLARLTLAKHSFELLNEEFWKKLEKSLEKNGTLKKLSFEQKIEFPADILNILAGNVHV